MDEPEARNVHRNDTDDLLREITGLLPSVIEVLRDENKLDMYLKFQHLLAEIKLPLDNIAFLLFQDIIEWYSLEQTGCMRYSPEVKQFWRIGYKLFKGRFLRFMSGMKNQGQEGPLKPSESAINFVVPDVKSLEYTEFSNSLKNVEPRIFTEMIEMLDKDDTKQNKTYKLCFDGKKLNPGVENQLKGDVNLWGYEGPPSLKQKQVKAKEDVDTLANLERVISSLEQRDLTDVLHAPSTIKDEIVCTGKLIIQKLVTALQLRLIVERS